MKTFLLSIAALTLFLLPSTAQARIDIVPKKVLIEARERSGEFTILNLFNKTGTFRVELLNYQQDEDGVYKKLKTPLDPSFDPNKIVRFSPRQFTIDQGERQKVRLSIRKPANLPEGEYRFHVKATRFATKQERKDSIKDNSVSMLMNTAIVIPVIVRHGNTQLNTQLANASLIPAVQNKNGRPAVLVDVLRDGTASAIGKLDAYWQPQKGKTKKIGTIVNANVFTEINRRRFKIPLTELPAGNGNVLIRYSDGINEGKILDEITIQR